MVGWLAIWTNDSNQSKAIYGGLVDAVAINGNVSKQYCRLHHRNIWWAIYGGMDGNIWLNESYQRKAIYGGLVDVGAINGRQYMGGWMAIYG